MKRSVILAASAALFLGGCGLTQTGSAIEESVRQKAAQAYDGGLENAVQFICNDASKGSIDRKFGGMEDIYNDFCDAAFRDAVDLKPAGV